MSTTQRRLRSDYTETLTRSVVSRLTAARQLRVDFTETPIGRFAIVADERGHVRAAGFVSGHARMQRLLQSLAQDAQCTLTHEPNPAGVSERVERYFVGDLAAFEGMPVELDGTPFQREVWRALCDIPSGQTRSYGDIATSIGRPTAVRAVGLANGSNPISLIVPCHRVIGSSGSLTGYAGGIERKRWLLQHERALGLDADAIKALRATRSTAQRVRT